MLSYQYAPIAAGYIRLLKLLPGNARSVLRGTLYRHPLNVAESLNYLAISYAWGDSTCEHTIEIAGKSLKIPKSAYNALTGIQETDPCCRLWIDAVFINQSDADEKPQQVQQMRQVYERAAEVVIWLALSAADITPAYQWLCVFGRLFQASGMSRMEFAKCKLLARPSKRQFASLIRLFDAPYFSRLWTIPEALSARRSRLHCGTLSLQWELIAGLLIPLTVLIKEEEKTATAVSTPDHMVNLFDLVSFMFKHPSVRVRLDDSLSRSHDSLANTMARLDRFCATDPRDYVYIPSALMHQLWKGNHADLLMKIDYGANTSTVWQRATIWGILRDCSLDLLSLASIKPLDHNGNTLLDALIPSWLPSFDEIPKQDIRGQFMLSRTGAHAPAGNEHRPQSERQIMVPDFESSELTAADRNPLARSVLADLGPQRRREVDARIHEVLEAIPFHYDESAQTLSVA